MKIQYKILTNHPIKEKIYYEIISLYDSCISLESYSISDTALCRPIELNRCGHIKYISGYYINVTLYHTPKSSLLPAELYKINYSDGFKYYNYRTNKTIRLDEFLDKYSINIGDFCDIEYVYEIGDIVTLPDGSSGKIGGFVNESRVSVYVNTLLSKSFNTSDLGKELIREKKLEMIYEGI